MIEQKLSDIETQLSNISKYPLIGTVAGIVKIVLGILQTSVALITGILIGTFGFWSEKGCEIAARSFSIALHGVANVIVGILESIPIVQTLLWIARPENSLDQVEYFAIKNECENKSPSVQDKLKQYSDWKCSSEINENEKPNIALTLLFPEDKKFLAYHELYKVSNLSCTLVEYHSLDDEKKITFFNGGRQYTYQSQKGNIKIISTFRVPVNLLEKKIKDNFISEFKKQHKFLVAV